VKIMEGTLTIPEGVTMKVEKHEVIVTGKLGEVRKVLSDP